MKVVRVVNNVAPAGSVAIGRGTVWGNPFIIGADGERLRVIAKFREYAAWRLTREPNWLEPLRGKNLACYCAPNACHGDVIIQLLKETEKYEMPEPDDVLSKMLDEMIPGGIRYCSDCKFDMDAMSAVPCTSHKWHNNDAFDDMCCLCGLDAEMLVK
jgi:hypothetical protein